MEEEIYPMPSFPMLIVKDLEASSDFYQNALGFRYVFTIPGPGGPPALAHLRWVKYADLLITRPLDGNDLTVPKGRGVILNFSMLDRFDGDIDAFAGDARKQGAQVTGPISQPWNVREVTVIDPDGYKLTFTVPLSTHVGFDKVIERASDQ